jgi:DNA-binding NarL/FixJ family response regulator
MNDKSSPPPSRTILVVEDNDIYRDVVCAALRQRFPDWEILIAASVADAAEVVRGNSIHVAVTDLSLPDGSGLDLLPLFAQDRAKGLKLIALTNDSAQDVLAGLKRHGYHAFVAKEHGLKALCDSVETVLAGEEFISGGADSQ